VHRIGHHVRESIVERARDLVGEEEESTGDDPDSEKPEPIPETQEEINAQADAALRDLFPRIPNTDRQMVIEHAFRKVCILPSRSVADLISSKCNRVCVQGVERKGGPLVGLAPDISLSRRVQLAVLAHIRHTHTRYDQLLKEADWASARKAVEALCLDIIVKWRGDEETGRDQLDEILREVVVISDDSNDESDNESNDDSSDESIEEIHHTAVPAISHPAISALPGPLPGSKDVHPNKQTSRKPRRRAAKRLARLAAKKRQWAARSQAARLARWDEARSRLRDESMSDERVSYVAPSAGPVGYEDSSFDTYAANSFQLYSRSQHNPRYAPPTWQHPAGSGPPAAHARRPEITQGQISPSRVIFEPLRQPMPVTSHRQNGSEGARLQDLPSDPTVRRSHLQDYLVPSVEATSPIAQRPPAPIFVRPISSPHPGKAHHVQPYSPTQPVRRPSPRFQTEYDEPNKRRRTADIPAGFVDYRSELEPPRLRVVDPPPASSFISRSGDPVRVITIPDSAPQQSYTRPGAVVLSRQIVDAKGVVLRESPAQPVIVEDYAIQRSRLVVVPRRETHDYTVQDKEPKIIETGRPLQRDFDERRIYEAEHIQVESQHIYDQSARREPPRILRRPPEHQSTLFSQRLPPSPPTFQPDTLPGGGPLPQHLQYDPRQPLMLEPREPRPRQSSRLNEPGYEPEQVRYESKVTGLFDHHDGDQPRPSRVSETNYEPHRDSHGPRQPPILSLHGGDTFQQSHVREPSHEYRRVSYEPRPPIVPDHREGRYSQFSHRDEDYKSQRLGYESIQPVIIDHRGHRLADQPPVAPFPGP
jgi:hypothetical protein